MYLFIDYIYLCLYIIAYQDYVYIYTHVIDQTYLNVLCVYTISDHMRVTEFKKKTLGTTEQAHSLFFLFEEGSRQDLAQATLMDSCTLRNHQPCTIRDYPHPTIVFKGDVMSRFCLSFPHGPFVVACSHQYRKCRPRSFSVYELRNSAIFQPISGQSKSSSSSRGGLKQTCRGPSCD